MCDDLDTIDLGGPTPVDDDSTVVVDSLPPLLSQSQQQALMQEIPDCESLTEEWMINSFTIGKVFVHQSCS